MFRNNYTVDSLLLFVTALLFSACVPGPYEYFEPNAPEGELVHSLCAHLAPKDTIEFQMEGVTAQIKGYETWLSISIYVPEGKSIQFMSVEVKLYEEDSEKLRHFKITDAVYYDGQPTGYVTVSPADIMVGRTKPLTKFGVPADRLFELSVQLDEKRKEHFFVRFPVLRIGENILEFPIVEFIKRTGIGVMPVNC